MTNEELNTLSGIVIGAAIEVHRILGPGLLEHSYQHALAQELKLRGIKAEMEVEIPFIYKGEKLDVAYRADIIVNDSLILELKATENYNPVHAKQLLTYLRLADKRLGLVINFNRDRCVDGIERVVNAM